MRRLLSNFVTDGVTVLSAVGTAVFPPVAGVDVTAWGIVPEFDLEFSADGACTVTLAERLGAVAESQIIADDDVDTTDFANNELDITGHATETGDGPIQTSTSDTLPTGLALLTNYFVIKKDANTIQLATSRANALAGTAVAFSDVGVGTHTIEDTATTTRLNWTSLGLLGQSDDGALVVLAADKRFSERVKHSPRFVAYSVTATISANNLTVKAYPVAEA